MAEQSLLEQLNQGWLVLEPGGQVLAVISPVHAEGLAAPLYTDRQGAEQMAQGEMTVHPMPPLWETARLLAAQGFAGMMVDDHLPLLFVTTEQGSALPTHVAIPQAADFLVVGPQGETALGKEDVALWLAPELFDRLAIERLLGDELPFAGYEPDMALWEYLPGDQPQPTTDRGVLLPPEGDRARAVALFSAEFAAEWYWQSLLGDLPPELPPVSEELCPHDDIVALLEARSRTGLPVILNPSRHRFHQGFFRKLEAHWLLVTINGVWRVEPPFHCVQVARRKV